MNWNELQKIDFDDLQKIEEALRSGVAQAIIDRNGHKHFLDAGELRTLSPEYLNSPEHLKYWRERLINNSEKYPVLNEMEETWGLISCHLGKLCGHRGMGSYTPLGDLLYRLEFGFYPTPESLMGIKECFDYYFGMAGKVSLDEVFFEKPQKGVGNHAAQKDRSEPIEYLHFLFHLEERNIEQGGGKAKSQIELAEKTINAFLLDIDPESLLRQYRRWLKSSGQTKR